MKMGLYRSKSVLQGVGNVVGGLFPGLQYRTCNVPARKADRVVNCLRDLIHLLSPPAADDLFLLRRDRGVADSNGDGALGGIFIALGLDVVQHFSRSSLYRAP